MNVKKYDFIDLLKTIAMVMVIFYHCILFFCNDSFWPISAGYMNSVCVFLANFFDVIAVPVFVFASGFLLRASLDKRDYKTTELIRKKANRLLKTYFVYGLLWLAPTYTLFNISSYGRPENANLWDGYKAMLLGKFSDVSWFLLMLFWITLLFILIRKYTTKDKLWVGVALTTAITLLCRYGLNSMDYYKLSQIHAYIPVYFMGIVFHQNLDKLDEIKKEKLLLISIAGILACVFACQYSNEILNSIIHIASPVFLSVLSMSICKYKEIHNSFYDWLIKNNMYIYLFQMPGIYKIYAFLYPFVGQNALLCSLLCFVLGVLLDFLLVYLFNIVTSCLSKFLKRPRIVK